ALHGWIAVQIRERFQRRDERHRVGRADDRGAPGVAPFDASLLEAGNRVGFLRATKSAMESGFTSTIRRITNCGLIAFGAALWADGVDCVAGVAGFCVAGFCVDCGPNPNVTAVA